jgi:Protein of unknown function (DUF3015)
MKIMRIAFLPLLGLFALPSLASDREFADIYTDCGLGALIAPRNDAVAAVTNVTWDLGTTAITSDASSPDSCKGGKTAAASLILEAYPSLEQDLARGDGEHVATLIGMVGCPASARPAVTAALRAEFAKVAVEAGYSSRTRYENAERLYGLLTQASTSSCATG